LRGLGLARLGRRNLSACRDMSLPALSLFRCLYRCLRPRLHPCLHPCLSRCLCRCLCNLLRVAIFDEHAGASKFGPQGPAHDRRGHRADQALQVPECPLWLHCDPSGGTGPDARWLTGSPGQLGARPLHHRRRCIQARCPGLLRRVSSIWASYAPCLLKIAVTSSGEANSPLSAAAMPFWTSATNQAW